MRDRRYVVQVFAALAVALDVLGAVLTAVGVFYAPSPEIFLAAMAAFVLGFLVVSWI